MASLMKYLREFLGLGFYTSELDVFLKQWDQQHPQLSASQRQEVNKYQRVYRLRDQAVSTPEAKTFWDKF
jgi:hypothetical protein